MMRCQTFDAFVSRPGLTREERAQLDEAKATALAFAQGSLTEQWFVLGGSIGWGKSHLAIAIINHWIEHGRVGAKYVRCPQYLRQL